MNHADEFLHLVKQAAQQEFGNYRPFIYGHISSYDPQLHRVRCIIPSLRDSTGRAMLSPWMPLGSIMVGAGYGMQIAPYGGATFDDPTAGEQVEIHYIDRVYGASIAAHLCFNQVMLPPVTDLEPGGAILQHKSGSFWRLFGTGDIEVSAARDLILDAGRDVLVSGARDFILNAARNITAVATAIARLVGDTTQLHATTEIRYDADGTGVSVMPAEITNYTEGVPQTTVAPTPPEIA